MADNIRFSTNEYLWGGQQPTPAVKGAVDLAKTEVEKAIDVLEEHVAHLGEDSVIRVYVGGTNPPVLSAAHGDLWWGTGKWQRIAPFGNLSATNHFEAQFPLSGQMDDFYVSNGEVEPGLVEDNVQEIRYIQNVANEFRAGFVVHQAGTVTFAMRSTQVSALRSFHLRAIGFALDQRVVLDTAETWYTVIVDAPGPGTIYLTPADVTSRVGDVIFIKEITVGPEVYFNGEMRGCTWMGTPGRSKSLYAPGWGNFPGFDHVLKLLTEESYNDGFMDIYMTSDQPVFPDEGDLWYNGTTLARWEDVTWVNIPIGGSPEIEDRIVIIEDDLVDIHDRINNIGDEMEFPDLDQVLDWIADSGAILDILLGGKGVIPIAVIDSLWTKIVRAKQITTDMLLVASGENLVVDPHLLNDELAAQRILASTGTWTIVSEGGDRILNVTGGATRTLRMISAPGGDAERVSIIEPGSSYRIRYDIRRALGTVSQNVRPVIYVLRTTGAMQTIYPRTANITPDSSWFTDEVRWTAPDDAIGMYMGVVLTGGSTATHMQIRRTRINSLTDPALFVDGMIHATIGLGTDGKFIADDDGITWTEMSAQGIEHWGVIEENVESGNSIPQRISRFGRDLQFLTSHGIKGIDENGDASVRDLSTDVDPHISGTPLLGTLALRNDEVDLNTEMGHLDQLTFGGPNYSHRDFNPSGWIWNVHGEEKTALEIMREQQAGRALLVVAHGRVRFAALAEQHRMVLRVRKTQANLTPPGLVVPQPTTSSSLFGREYPIDVGAHATFTQIMGLHQPARSETARWLLTVESQSSFGGGWRVEDAGISFIDIGTRDGALLDTVSRVVADGSSPPPEVKPKKTYTSRWYANSINRWQGTQSTSSGDRAGQALQGWSNGMNGQPFHSILGFTGTAHYGESGATLNGALAGATITRVRIRVSHAAGNWGIPARLGIQSSSTAMPVINQTVTATNPGQTLYHIMSSTFRNGLSSGMRYITFGPHVRSGNHYASYHGTSGGNSRRVELEITYSK